MVKATLYLLHYNNYYNRLVKKEETLADYLEYQLGEAITGVNFIPSDFIDAQQIINWNYDDPDYLVVVDEYGMINSRWFVVSTTRTRAGQLQLELHRDLIVDYYDNLMDEKTAIFVEKATLTGDNDLIFNSENMSFNQIKQKETLLKDQSECPWICIYAASKQADGTTTTFNASMQDQNIPTLRTFDSVEDFNNWDFKKKADAKQPIKGGNLSYIGSFIRGIKPTNRDVMLNYSVTQLSASVSTSSVPDPNVVSFSVRDDLTEQQVLSYFQSEWNNIQNSLVSYIDNYDNSTYKEIGDYNGQYVKVKVSDSEYKMYRIGMIDYSGMVDTFYGKVANMQGSLYNSVLPIIQKMSYLYPINGTLGLPNGNIVDFNYIISARTPVLTDVSSILNSVNINITANRLHLTDAPYDMFCMPYSDDLYIANSSIAGFKRVQANKQVALSTARALIETYAGGGQVYDAQILPYCPLTTTNIYKSNGDIVLDINNSSDTSFTPIKNGADTTIGYILHAINSSFNRQIELEEPIVIQDYKVESECDMYRLVSPNYNGIFEFNAAKNDGISLVNVQCTYKPYTPYIKVYPDFKRLYGSDFNDMRGLICGGDFSLPMTTSAWETYELQNKNYQLSFQREIQNMEVSNAVQREQQIWNIATGGLMGAGTGAVVGSTYGGGLGAGIGAGIGGITSIAGGIRDLQLSDKLRQEALDYKNDMFGYQLGNIKALPQSLSKVSAYNIDNKYFPFLEYYSCSEVEKKALRDKIKYNGMTVMTIGNMVDYVNTYVGEEPMYFKGRLIRLEGIDEDFHVINAIADELYKGVFI